MFSGMRPAKKLFGILALAIVVAVLPSLGCPAASPSPSPTAAPSPAAVRTGTLYVAVTGDEGGEVAGTPGSGLAIIDLSTKKVEYIKMPDVVKAPHGVIFPSSTNTILGGRVAKKGATYSELIIGDVNASEGAAGKGPYGGIAIFDLKTKTAKRVYSPTAMFAICGMTKGPDGKIYLGNMVDGKIYPYDETTKTYGEAKPGTDGGACGVSFTPDGKYYFVSNMWSGGADFLANKLQNIKGYTNMLEWPTGTKVATIETTTTAGAVTMHQEDITPDGKYLYITDGQDFQMVKIDVAKKEVVKRIDLGSGAECHSIVISSDGKWGYIAVRHQPTKEQSSVFVLDLSKDEVVDRIPIVDSTRKDSAPLVCGICLAEK